MHQLWINITSCQEVKPYQQPSVHHQLSSAHLSSPAIIVPSVRSSAVVLGSLEPSPLVAATPLYGDIASPPRSGAVLVPPLYHTASGAMESATRTVKRQRGEQQLGEDPRRVDDQGLP